MRVIKYRDTVPNATFSETEAINLKVQEHGLRSNGIHQCKNGRPLRLCR